MQNRIFPDGANMKFRMFCAILIVAATACHVAPADAGQWNYGCKGNLTEGTVIFDRNQLLVMPKELARGDISGLTSGEISAFDAADNNSGFMPVMKFARGAYPDQKIVLTEKSSKKISEKTGHVGTRERSVVTTRKAYRYQHLYPDGTPDEADITMDCIEYELTAP